jgi:hypothetical protein
MPPVTTIEAAPASPLGASIAYVRARCTSGVSTDLLGGATFEVQLNTDPFKPWNCTAADAFAYSDAYIMGGSAAALMGTATVTAATTGRCVLAIPLAAPSQSVAQIRCRYSGVESAAAAVSLSFQYCTAREYASVDASNGRLSCTPCAAGAECSDPRTTFVSMPARPGYWSVAGSPNFYACDAGAGACLGGSRDSGTRSACALGYSGLLCSVCVDGYYASYGGCAPCPSGAANVSWSLVGAVLGAIVVAGALGFRFRAYVPARHIKLLIAFAQVLSAANTVRARRRRRAGSLMVTHCLFPLPTVTVLLTPLAHCF